MGAAAAAVANLVVAAAKNNDLKEQEVLSGSPWALLNVGDPLTVSEQAPPNKWEGPKARKTRRRSFPRR